MSSTATLHPSNPRRSTTPPLGATDNDGDLPLDLLYEILLRLPTEPVCRFRAVCKSWRSLLCHRDFIAAAHNPGPLLAIGLRDSSYNKEVHVMDMESGEAVKDVKIAAANDAFLPPCKSGDSVIWDMELLSRLRLLDLATGTFSFLPNPTPRLSYSRRSGIVGRAACTGERKVLAIFTTCWHHKPQVCKIFTLGNGGWRDTGSPPMKVMWHTGTSRDLAIVNGVMYFLSQYEMLHRHKIMAFDLNSEAWRPVETCILGPTERVCHMLAELDGYLVAGHTDRFQSTEIELWFLMDVHRSDWSKRYVITMPCHQNLPGPTCYEYIEKPLAMLDDGRIVLWIRVAGLEIGAEIDVLWIYNPRTKTFMKGTRVTCCSRVSVFTSNLLDSRGRGPIDMAAKSLLIARRHHKSGAPSSTET